MGADRGRRRFRWVLPAMAYGLSALAFRAEPGRAERAVFTVVNDGPNWRWLRVPQQLGTPWVPPAIALWAWTTGRRRDAVVAAATLPVVKGAEVATKKLLQRPRPLYTTPTELRDDAPVEGPSFPSGHTAIATAATVLLAARAPASGRVVLLAALATSAYVRVHQGAHHPTDVVGGFFLGWAVADLLDAVVPRARGQRP